jgi:hypothetical protein
MNFDITKYTIEELISLKDEISSRIHQYDDGYIYICNVRSYGRNWVENLTNTHSLQELCNVYDGDNGIIDVYSTNPDLSHIDCYGGLRYIKSKKDYEQWKEYRELNYLIVDIADSIVKWNNRDKISSFYSRPMFEPVYTLEDLENFKKKLEDFDMNFSEPSPYLKKSELD